MRRILGRQLAAAASGQGAAELGDLPEWNLGDLYSGMEATRFLLAGDSDFRLEGGLNERLLAVTVGVTLYSVCSICLLVFAVLTFARRPARLRLPGGSDRRLRRLS